LSTAESVGVLGATSQFGSCLLGLFNQSGQKVVAFSRQAHSPANDQVEWYQLGPDAATEKTGSISKWIVVAPIWVLPTYFDLLEASGAQTLVAVSSTSRFTKLDSIDPAEQAVAHRLIDSEAHVQEWAEARGIDWVILRPTLIYGQGKDKNVTEITRFISRWRFFPILGKGDGLRQPVHVEDVAKVCVAALSTKTPKNRAYNISGAETLAYIDLVKRVFKALGIKPRFVHLPRWLFRFALLVLGSLPRFQHWSIAMVDRMSRDMVFDHSDAKQAFGFTPRPFVLGSEDLPKC
jgi:nucleoside-diphosphate-sugar epimerase